VDLAAVERRMTVRTALQEGRVDSAIDMVNDLNPETLDAWVYATTGLTQSYCAITGGWLHLHSILAEVSRILCCTRTRFWLRYSLSHHTLQLHSSLAAASLTLGCVLFPT